MYKRQVSTKALTELVLETIRTTASYAIQNKEEFIQKVRSISQVRQQEAAKELKRKVAKAKKRIAELDMLIKKLYETYALGKLEEKRFEMPVSYTHLLVGTLLGTDHSHFENVADDLFQALPMLFIHCQQEEGHHDQHHTHGGHAVSRLSLIHI